MNCSSCTSSHGCLHDAPCWHAQPSWHARGFLDVRVDMVTKEAKGQFIFFTHSSLVIRRYAFTSLCRPCWSQRMPYHMPGSTQRKRSTQSSSPNSFSTSRQPRLALCRSLIQMRTSGDGSRGGGGLAVLTGGGDGGQDGPQE